MELKRERKSEQTQPTYRYIELGTCSTRATLVEGDVAPTLLLSLEVDFFPSAYFGKIFI